MLSNLARWANLLVSCYMDMNLQQKLGQQQILSPQMRKGLELLQSSSLELSQLIQQALVSNPVLEQESIDAPLEDEQIIAPEKDGETISELADDYRENHICESRSTSPSITQETRDFLYDSIVAPKTLQQHLLNQLSLAGKPAQIHLAAETIIGSLDDRGFLTETLEDIAQREAIPREILLNAKAVVQGFTPSGVAADDIKESLLIQLNRRGQHSALAQKIIENHLKDLAQNKIPEIAKSLSTSHEAVVEILEQISTLRMNPGADFDPTHNPQIQPDIIISYGRDGELQAHLTDAYLPQLSISSNYKDLLSCTPDSEVRKFLKDHIQEGRSLIKSLGQRQQTLLKIAEVLMDSQKEFFKIGSKGLKPLTMHQLADLIKVHPTTISRACAAKYLLSPQGIFELRYFFTSGVSNIEGTGVSNTSIRDSIKNIVDGEDSKKPYSDSFLVDLLKKDGIKVARRTVAKYREQLGIAPSHLRRKF